MDKKEFVHSLNKVKLVLGNGFDLHCGLHTKYSDFYCWSIEKFLELRKMIKSYCDNGDMNFFENDKINHINVWDIFFAINSKPKPSENVRRWCDIENLMLSSFLTDEESKDQKFTSIYGLSKIHWDYIYDNLEDDISDNSRILQFLIYFIFEKMRSNNIQKSKFYLFLLNELKDFEKNFGKFIYNQQNNHWLEFCNHFTKKFPRTSYFKRADDTILEICNENCLISIDSFNYGTLSNKFSPLLMHINGDTNFPIFGIDTIFSPDDVRFIFTKTSRRISLDSISESIETNMDLENVIIFGHSLDKADYSYFFPIFDKVMLTDYQSTGTVVFAFDIYNKKNEIDIKSNLMDSVSKIIYEYALEKRISNPSRLLDSLSTQKRIILYEIPCLKRENYSYDEIDSEWDDIYKKVQTLK